MELQNWFSKISIHSLGFRIFVLLAVMIVLFCALVAYNNTAAFVLMLERIHENSENTLVLYQKSLDENLSRTETYLFVFALNDADLLSLRAEEGDHRKNTEDCPAFLYRPECQGVYPWKCTRRADIRSGSEYGQGNISR